ncbi:MAG TPA: hypothetical protein VLU98_03605, partial [Methanomicrobiales archaeon]|nr:hypothetical protein [Methanomicrobiales archaeon]
MKSVEQRLAVIFGVLLLLALVGIAAAAAAAPSTAEGCVYRDLNGNRVKDASEACEPGWTLHAKILDNNGIVRQEGDFVTDTAGTSGKFSYPIPAATAGSWSVVISETPPTGFVVDSPTGASYTKTYTASLKTVSGFAFGNQQVTASAEGCAWVDTDSDRQKDDNELCQAGWTLHATVTDDQGGVVSDGDFVTNTLGTNGKFSFQLPVPPTGKTWKATISEVAPNGYVNVVPVGGSYAKNFSAINPVISGFSFGDQQVSASAEGCAWVDTDSDRQKDDNELCQAGWTLHATVTDDQGGVVSDGDFVTNTLGTNGKFSYPLPVPPTGKTWKATISEIAPNGWVNVVPVGGSYTKAYSAINPVIGGYSFGNQAVTASAEGCKWV